MSQVTSGAESAQISIIIVNWKVSDLVGALLYSIAKETKGITYEIFVVDNDSDDDIREVVVGFLEGHPGVKTHFIGNDRNLGFAAANNLAISQASGRYVVLLNPDTELKDDALSKMVAWMDAHPDVGLAGPKLLNADGTLQPSVRALPRLLDQTLILLKAHRYARNLPPLKRYFEDAFDYGKTQDVEQLMGAALFVRKDVFTKIGLLDEAFFIWFEEVDFCRRAQTAGFRVVYVSDIAIVHHGGESFSKSFTMTKQKYFNDSMMAYFRKHHRARAWALAVPLAVGLGLAAVVSIFRRK
jgi:hypothetical protein